MFNSVVEDGGAGAQGHPLNHPHDLTTWGFLAFIPFIQEWEQVRNVHNISNEERGKRTKAFSKLNVS